THGLGAVRRRADSLRASARCMSSVSATTCCAAPSPLVTSGVEWVAGGVAAPTAQHTRCTAGRGLRPLPSGLSPSAPASDRVDHTAGCRGLAGSQVVNAPHYNERHCAWLPPV